MVCRIVTLIWLCCFACVPFQRAEGAWQPPETIVNEFAYSDTAIDPMGNITVIWEKSGTMYASTKMSGGSWQQTPSDLGPAGFVATGVYPSVVADASGNVTAAWFESDSSGLWVVSSQKPFGGNWESAQRISTTASSSGGTNPPSPRLAVGPSGDVTAVWRLVAVSGTGNEIQASTRTLESTIWGPPQTVADNTATTDLLLSPDVAIGPDNLPIVVWDQHVASTGEDFIWSSKWNGGSWGAALQLGKCVSWLAPEVHQLFKIAIDSNGNLTVAWFGYDGSLVEVLQSSTRGPSDTNWPAPVVIDLSPHTDLALATDAAGNLAIAWGKDDSIRTSIRLVGGSWEAPQTISSPGASGPDIAISPLGDITAVWMLIGSLPSSTIQSSTRTLTGGWQATPDTVPFSNYPGEAIIVFDMNGVPTVIAAGSDPSSGIGYLESSSTQGGSTPLPPRHFKGSLKKRHHTHKHQYRLKTKWHSSPSSNIGSYRIYKRSKVVRTIPADKKHRFKTHLQWKKSTKKFSITAVNTNNTESAQQPLKIHH